MPVALIKFFMVFEGLSFAGGGALSIGVLIKFPSYHSDVCNEIIVRNKSIHCNLDW